MQPETKLAGAPGQSPARGFGRWLIWRGFGIREHVAAAFFIMYAPPATIAMCLPASSSLPEPRC